MQPAGAGGAAYDATATTDHTTPPTGAKLAYHAALAADAQAAITKIEGQIAGMQATLAAKRAELAQARTALREGDE